MSTSADSEGLVITNSHGPLNSSGYYEYDILMIELVQNNETISKIEEKSGDTWIDRTSTWTIDSSATSANKTFYKNESGQIRVNEQYIENYSIEGVDPSASSSTKKFLDGNGLERYTNQIKSYFAGAELSETQPTKETISLWIEKSDLEETASSGGDDQVLIRLKALEDTAIKSSSITNIVVVTEYPTTLDSKTLYIKVGE